MRYPVESSTDMVFQAVVSLREADQVATATGAAMMIIHHNGKDAAKGARGSC